MVTWKPAGSVKDEGKDGLGIDNLPWWCIAIAAAQPPRPAPMMVTTMPSCQKVFWNVLLVEGNIPRS